METDLAYLDGRLAKARNAKCPWEIREHIAHKMLQRARRMKAEMVHLYQDCKMFYSSDPKMHSEFLR
jgi:hypothetical protein